MKVKKCCCCIPVDMGVMILGSLMCFGIMAEFKEFNPIRAAITVGASFFFFLMVFRDSAKHREIFFYAYIVSCISELFFSSIIILEKMNSSKLVEEKCQEMEKDGDFKDGSIRSMAECREKMGQILELSAYIAIVLVGLILFHFCIVMHTHWKNFGREFMP